MVTPIELDIPTPKFENIEIDVEEIFNAIQKNGYEHARGVWFNDDKTAACVLGQGALNLGVAGSPNEFEHVWERWFVENTDELGNAFIEWAKKEDIYDEDLIPQDHLYVDFLDRIQNKFVIGLEKALNSLGTVPSDSRWYYAPFSPIGIAIEYWNDLSDGSEYVLKTYDEVVEMVYDLLSPHFGTKVAITKYDYGV